jgi:hypothetical protein
MPPGKPGCGKTPTAGPVIINGPCAKEKEKKKNFD